MYLAWSMNYFHINIENREKTMPLIFKPLSLEALCSFFFPPFFFLFFPFSFFLSSFLLSLLFCLVFWSRCLRFNLLQGQILTDRELTLQYQLSSCSGRGLRGWALYCLVYTQPRPLWFSTEECVLPFVCMCLTWRNNSRANLVCTIESRELWDAYLRKIITVIRF